MNDLDLAQHQFDFDLTWAALFLHSDGTVFARYGSRTKEGPMAINSVAGLTKTMERVLEEHSRYPKNRDFFAAKKGPSPKVRLVKEIPSKRIRKILARKPGREQCIHCHNVYDAFHDVALDAGTYDPRKLWKYPLPDSVGVVLERTGGRRVERVVPDSAAARAGIRPGDELDTLGGQKILSFADVQFVLHHLPVKTELPATLKRDGGTIAATLALSGKWREGNLSWRGSMYGMPPSPGLWVQAFKPDAKKERGIAANQLALNVRGIFGSAVRRSGLKKGDVIVGYDGHTEHRSEGEFHAYLRLNHYRPGSVLRLDVLRKGERRSVTVKF